MTMFFNVIDVACVAAFDLYAFKFSNWNLRTDKRRTFLLKLDEQFINDQIFERLSNSKHVYGNIAQAIRSMGYTIIELGSPTQPNRKRQRRTV